jgi:hypothetical protein
MMTVPAIRCRTYQDLTQALAARRRQLGLRQLDADEKSSLQPGYVGKLECGDRHLGPVSLPMILAAYDCDLLLCARSSTAPVDHRGLSATKADRIEQRALPVRRPALPKPEGSSSP